MVHFSTVSAKFQVLKMRRDEEKALGVHIDRMMQKAKASNEQRSIGCSSGVCAWLVRRFGRQKVDDMAAAVDVASTSNGTSTNMEVHARIFGLAGVKSGDPAKKLDQAAQIMRGRIQQLESRAAEQRVEALKMQRTGQKPSALRALKKAKQIESQIVANQASLDACEQQVDLLAQAAMQKTLTSALASTSKTMRADTKMLNKAEQAIDDASEARDMANDLSSVVAEFASNGHGDVDDEELLEELQQMVENDVPPQPSSALVAVDEGQEEEDDAYEISKKADIAALEKRVRIWDETQAARAVANALPDAPVGTPGKQKKSWRKEERAALLAM